MPKTIVAKEAVRHSVWLHTPPCVRNGNPAIENSTLQAFDEMYTFRNNGIFTLATRRLLTTVSRWRPRDGPGGLTLKMSVLPPSDTKHVFCDFRSDDDYPFKYEDDFINELDIAEFYQLKRKELIQAPGEPHHHLAQ